MGSSNIISYFVHMSHRRHEIVFYGSIQLRFLHICEIKLWFSKLSMSFLLEYEMFLLQLYHLSNSCPLYRLCLCFDPACDFTKP